jgi:hypothetical protein
MIEPRNTINRAVEHIIVVALLASVLAVFSALYRTVDHSPGWLGEEPEGPACDKCLALDVTPLPGGNLRVRGTIYYRYPERPSNIWVQQWDGLSNTIPNFHPGFITLESVPAVYIYPLETH